MTSIPLAPGRRYDGGMSFNIIPFDGEDVPITRVVLDADTPWESVKEQARQALLHPEAALVIVTNDAADELWRYPEGLDA